MGGESTCFRHASTREEVEIKQSTTLQFDSCSLIPVNQWWHNEMGQPFIELRIIVFTSPTKRAKCLTLSAFLFRRRPRRACLARRDESYDGSAPPFPTGCPRGFFVAAGRGRFLSLSSSLAGRCAPLYTPTAPLFFLRHSRVIVSFSQARERLFFFVPVLPQPFLLRLIAVFSLFYSISLFYPLVSNYAVDPCYFMGVLMYVNWSWPVSAMCRYSVVSRS